MQREFDLYDWERAAVRELNQEYVSVLLQRRLKMRPAAIELFDSETHWGSWSPLTRTVSISRKLIRSHAWSQVLGILRHEMAHQYVDEELSGHELPHGERFKTACKILGVPQEYARATASLATSAIDWRMEKRDEDSERLLDKVRKLLALATSSNEHEALLAMNKVRELYAKYNLEHAAESAREQFAHLVITHRKKRVEAHQSKIIGILVGHFFVQVLHFKMFDAMSGEHHQAIEIVGKRENVLMAEYVYHFLLQQTENRVQEAAKAAGRKLTFFERKSYRLGILHGFAEKLTRSESSSPETPTPRGRSQELSLIGKALVSFKKDSKLDDYLGEIYPRLRTRGTSFQGVDSHAFDAGFAVGRTITLNKAVTSREGNRGLLLS